MKREDIAKIFEGATDEQINKVLDINSADIGKAKGSATKLQEDLDAANAALTKANDTIKALEASKGDFDKIQKELDDYKAAEQKRIADEKAAAERSELLTRMDAVMGDRKFIHDRMRDIVADDFAKALAEKANVGKSDADVFESITRDQGYFANQNPAANMARPNESAFTGTVKDRASFLKLDFSEQMKFKQEHPNEFKQMFSIGQ